MREKERKREERKTNVLNLYSKLQGSSPHQTRPGHSSSLSKFEDCELSVPQTSNTQNALLVQQVVKSEFKKQPLCV